MEKMPSESKLITTRLNRSKQRCSVLIFHYDIVTEKATLLPRVVIPLSAELLNQQWMILRTIIVFQIDQSVRSVCGTITFELDDL